MTKRMVIILRSYNSQRDNNTDLRVADIATGADLYNRNQRKRTEALNEIARYEPKEILLNSDAAEKLSAEVELKISHNSRRMYGRFL